MTEIELCSEASGAAFVDHLEHDHMEHDHMEHDHMEHSHMEHVDNMEHDAPPFPENVEHDVENGGLEAREAASVMHPASKHPAAARKGTIGAKKDKNGKGPRNGVAWVKVNARGVCCPVKLNRHKLEQELGVQQRDLRVLDPHLKASYTSAILCREKALIVSLEHIRCIVTTDNVMVSNADDELVAGFLEHLQGKLTAVRPSTSFPVLSEAGKAKLLSKTRKAVLDGLMGVPEEKSIDDLPFELRVLEVCLEDVCGTFERDMLDLEEAAQLALEALTRKVSAAHLERERKIKNRLNRLRVKVETIKELLEKYLDNDSDMRDMNLTAKQRSDMWAPNMPGKGGDQMPPALSLALKRMSRRSMATSDDSSDDGDADVEEVEMLLEAYFMSIDNTWNRAQQLSEYIDDAEDYINLELDSQRNYLFQIDLVMAAFMTAITFINVITAVFGTNLNSKMQDGNWQFNTVIVTSCVLSIALFVAFMAFCKWKRILFY